MAVRRVVFRRIRTRDDARIVDDYSPTWGQRSLEFIRGTKPRYFIRDGRLVLCRAIENRKYVLRYASEKIAALGVRSFVEVGSGNGINILVLALLHPEIERLRGIELTENGVNAAKKMLTDPPIPELVYLTGLSAETVSERLRGRDISFEQGDMRKLPWEDESFDLVFSWVAFEQLPYSYLTAFREACRVSRRYVLFVESFREAQRNIFQRLNLANLDYFRSSYREVLGAGFRLVSFEPLAISKIKYTNGALLGEREFRPDRP